MRLDAYLAGAAEGRSSQSRPRSRLPLCPVALARGGASLYATHLVLLAFDLLKPVPAVLQGEGTCSDHRVAAAPALVEKAVD
jgi:hypothetical protein